MKNIKINLWSLFLVILIFLNVGCSRLLDIDLPKNEITDESVFSDSTSAQTALNGVYIAMMQAYSLDFCSGGITAFPGLSSDELGQSVSNSNDEFYYNKISSSNPTISSLWISAYKYIYAINACIEGIEMSSHISDSQKQPMLAEARFLRAFINFYLVNLFGDIPLVTGTDFRVNRILPRTSVNEIYGFIKDELMYSLSTFSKERYTIKRPGYYATLALLARVALFEKDYEAAVTFATQVINAPNMGIESSPETVFTPKSRETIWALSSVITDRATWEGYYFVPARATTVPRYLITENLLNSIAMNDQRKTWIGISTVRGVTYKYPAKYKQYSPSSEKEQYIVLRLGEQYLIRAEANAYLYQFDAAEYDINIIRKRSGLETFKARNDLEVFLEEIQEQRKLELMFEWGHRWFDLKRTERIDSVLRVVKPSWETYASSYPLPLSEIGSNPNLKQNNGY